MDETEWQALVQGAKASDSTSTQKMVAVVQEIAHAYLRARLHQLPETDIEGLSGQATARLFPHLQRTAFERGGVPREAFRSLVEKAVEHFFFEFLRLTGRPPNGVTGSHEPVGPTSEPTDRPPESAASGASAGARYPRELHQWALQNLDVEEAAATLNELREKGGLRLRDYLDELEQIVEGK